MKHDRVLILAVLIFSFFWQKMSFEAEASSKKASVTIEANNVVVKGFPVILKVTARGPQLVSKMSLFSETAEVDVTLVSKANNREYFINSTRGMDIFLTTRDGVPIDSGRTMFQTYLLKSEERTMLLDLSSLISEHGKGTIFNDIPPGKYSVSVKLPSSGKRSNSIDMEVRDPSKDEKLFLEKVLRLGVLLRRGEGVNWSKFLRIKLRIPKEELSTIGKVARAQLEFHMLLSKVLSSKILIKNIPINPLKTLPVPNYLESEKKCFLFEMEILSGLTITKKRKDKFLQKNPGLVWRLYDVKTKGKNFLLYK